ncbi:MAG: 2,3-bisphosphoglycerate-independent phosphoglycerate mutase, partial [Alphaproteobacteria bacterium]|nr:2,3-bisphosphoglycerate-independent phosphoglycerate mutase [Alphaproteobacteria bacterium]
GGVHGHQDHMAFVARHLAAEGVRGWLHFITDGRDTAPRSAINFYRDFQHGTDGVAPMVRVATLGGRYFAMDRDKNWQRTARAFNAIAHGIGDDATDVVAAIEQAYGRGQDDEFIEPVVFDGYGGMAAGDVVLVMNFRADRARQICTALVADDFSFFARDMGDNKFQPPACMAGLVEYSASLGEKMLTLFGKDQVVDTFGSVVAAAGLTQLRIAETEKYAHVTFFFNGGREEPYPREERIMVPSPKVATYDLAPAMSAEAVTLAVLESLHHKKHQVIILNYANPDMVGHCGKINAAVAALETLDGCLARLEQAMAAAGGTMVITADHGNIESMHDKKINQPNTAHTLNPVPFLLVRGRKTAKDGGAKDKIEKDIGHLRPAHFVNGAAVQTAGKLADIAPTMLALLGIAPPASMTGRSLLVQK